MMKIYAFDFDGTLTRRDSLLEIIRYARPKKEVARIFLRNLPWLVLMKLHLYSNHDAKQRVFRDCFGGMRQGAFDDLCRRFARDRQGILRKKGIEKVNAALAEGAQVLIVSASIDNWVQPFFPQVTVLGTQVEVLDGRLTGRFSTRNCYGREKVRRISALYPDRRSYELIAFGDSHGDSAMLDFANEAHYKPFRG